MTRHEDHEVLSEFTEGRAERPLGDDRDAG